MRKIIAVLAFVALSGCAQLTALKDAVEAGSGLVVNTRSMYVAMNTFDAVEVAVTPYLKLKYCNGTTPICQDPAARQVIIPAIRTGINARNSLKQFIRAHCKPDATGQLVCDQLGPQGVYDALTAATGVIRDAITTYHIGSN